MRDQEGAAVRAVFDTIAAVGWFIMAIRVFASAYDDKPLDLFTATIAAFACIISGIEMFILGFK